MHTNTQNVYLAIQVPNVLYYQCSQYQAVSTLDVIHDVAGGLAQVHLESRLDNPLVIVVSRLFTCGGEELEAPN
jgi:hypothetical protein